MNKFIKVLTTIVITMLLALVVFVPKTEAAITGEDVSELRGVWVSTVSNIDISKQNGTAESSIKEYQTKLIAILDKVESYGLNAIFFQIRPANDALYESAYNPWSEFLAGYGVNPGWDMLGWFIEKAHERGIELHAWLNPYRVTASTVTNGKTQEEIEQIKLDLRAKTLKAAPDIDNPLTIKEYSLFDKIQISLFQSITTRTAGFASIPQENLTNGSVLVSLLLMFIGGSPVGTAGGIKTITFVSLFAIAVASIRNKKEVVLFNRNLSSEITRKAVAVTCMSFSIMFVSSVLLSLTIDTSITNILYETISATATVGLSRNLTATLGTFGKLIIIVTMYFGRVGPISLAVALGSKNESQNVISEPTEELSIG